MADMDDQLTTRRIPISKIVFIGVIIVFVLFMLWRMFSSSYFTASNAAQKEKEKEGENEKEDKDNDLAEKQDVPPSEYESFMDRLQKGEQEARRRALLAVENEKKARVAEEEALKAKELERVKKHTVPVGSTI